MGYSTEYCGDLLFNDELKASELNYLTQFLGEDKRDHDDWEKNEYFNALDYSIDLKLKEDFTGIEWDGREKSYEMVAQINYIISQMQKIKPEFSLTGKMRCQGEDIDDRYDIVIKDGFAEKIDIIPEGTKIRCPHCGEEFYLRNN